jgi:prepilin-type N-terminal cleavage/methylation domain-containing protein
MENGMTTYLPFRQAGRRGFSMIELLVVLTVFGILLIIAAPSLTRMTSVSRVSAVIGEVSTDINYARMQAIRRGRSSAIVVATDGLSYQTSVDGVVLRTNSVAASHPDVVLGPAGGTISFNSRGMRQATSTPRIYAVRDADTAVVQVSGIGRVYRDY